MHWLVGWLGGWWCDRSDQRLKSPAGSVPPLTQTPLHGNDDVDDHPHRDDDDVDDRLWHSYKFSSQFLLQVSFEPWPRTGGGIQELLSVFYVFQSPELQILKKWVNFEIFRSTHSGNYLFCINPCSIDEWCKHQVHPEAHFWPRLNS